MKRQALYSRRVLLDDKLVDATIVIQGDQIETIQRGKISSTNFPIEDFGDWVIMPGLLDSHVHINEPGRTDWEGFDTATKAAAAGGVTTLIEMPLNADPVTTTRAAFDKKLSATEGKLHVHCGFWGGIIPGNLTDLDELIGSGVFGIKAFLTHSGIDEFPNVTEADLRKGLPVLKKHNVPLLVHAELDTPHDDQKLLEANPRSYQAYLASRPKSWEDKAIRLMIDLCDEFSTPVHIVHLSSSNCIDTLFEAQKKGIPITVETCQHYLFFNSEEIPDGQTQYKCAPPIRERENNDLLWAALKEGLFNVVVSDHSPAVPEIKELESGNLKKAWGGIAGLQFGLPAFWTKAIAYGLTLPQVVRLMSYNVAEFLHLENRKGKLLPGYDADLVVWNPEESFTVTKDRIEFKHKITPYEGYTLNGVVKKTYVGGQLVYDDGKFRTLSAGNILKRK